MYRYTDCTPMGLSKKQPALNSEKQNSVSLSGPAHAGRPPAYLISEPRQDSRANALTRVSNPFFQLRKDWLDYSCVGPRDGGGGS